MRGRQMGTGAVDALKPGVCRFADHQQNVVGLFRQRNRLRKKVARLWHLAAQPQTVGKAAGDVHGQTQTDCLPLFKVE
ncbi:hypothetical protein D3C76_1619630 [compost metagenome]